MESEKTLTLPRILDGKYFQIISVDKTGSVKARCVPCGSKKIEKIISGSLRSTSNFLTHLKRTHAALQKDYETAASDPAVLAKRKKMNPLPFPVTSISKASIKSHKVILRYIVRTMAPLTIVEDEAFKSMIKELNNDAQIQCMNTLVAQLADEFNKMKRAVRDKLETAKSIAVTSDIWSSKSRSFLGVTAHWLEHDLTRSSVILALKRFPGTHSYDRIARLLKEILVEYNIHHKTVAVTTDNASNFVKVFKEYGLESENQILDLIEEQEDVDIVEMPPLDFLLPRHLRCASHTLSLVATTDLDKETQRQGAGASRDKERTPNPHLTPGFKRILRSTFAKCCALWNKVGKSPKISESVKACIGVQVVRPCQTRWNSLYDSVAFLLKHKSKLAELFETAGVECLDDNEIDFMEDYKAALKPLATALDTLQGEKDFYFGYFAPTVIHLQNELKEIISNSNGDGHAPALAWSLHHGVNARFKNIVEFNLAEIKMEILSACTMPCFKLRWIPFEYRDQVKKMFTEELKSFQEAEGLAEDSNCASNSSSNVDLCKWDKMFGSDDDQVESIPAEVKALQFLKESDKSFSLLKLHSDVKRMFMYYNTPLPSSAPSERLFSYGGMILRPKRSNLTDERFETLAMLKLNQSVYSL